MKRFTLVPPSVIICRPSVSLYVAGALFFATALSIVYAVPVFKMDSEDVAAVKVHEVNISRATMEKYPDTGVLVLENRRITYIEYDAFSDKTQLRQLRLGNNRLHIPDKKPWFKHLYIQTLEITDNHLGPVYPVAFKEMPALRVVKMMGNDGCLQSQELAHGAHYQVVCDVVADVQDAAAVKVHEVNVSRAAMKVYRDVGVIMLENTHIAYIEYDAFSDKTQLRRLCLGHNALHIPDKKPWFKHLYIQTLEINDNHLGPVYPVAFKEMPALRVVKMMGNDGCLQSQELAHGAHYKVVCDVDSSSRQPFQSNSSPSTPQTTPITHDSPTNSASFQCIPSLILFLVALAVCLGVFLCSITSCRTTIVH